MSRGNAKSINTSLRPFRSLASRPHIFGGQNKSGSCGGADHQIRLRERNRAICKGACPDAELARQILSTGVGAVDHRNGVRSAADERFGSPLPHFPGAQENDVSLGQRSEDLFCELDRGVGRGNQVGTERRLLAHAPADGERFAQYRIQRTPRAACIPRLLPRGTHLPANVLLPDGHRVQPTTDAESMGERPLIDQAIKTVTLAEFQVVIPRSKSEGRNLPPKSHRPRPRIPCGCR